MYQGDRGPIHNNEMINNALVIVTQTNITSCSVCLNFFVEFFPGTAESAYTKNTHPTQSQTYGIPNNTFFLFPRIRLPLPLGSGSLLPFLDLGVTLRFATDVCTINTRMNNNATHMYSEQTTHHLTLGLAFGALVFDFSPGCSSAEFYKCSPDT